MKKSSYIECVSAIDHMCQVTYNNHGSYAYAAGFLGSQLATLMKDLPIHKQKEIFRALMQASGENAPEVQV